MQIAGLVTLKLGSRPRDLNEGVTLRETLRRTTALSHLHGGGTEWGTGYGYGEGVRPLAGHMLDRCWSKQAWGRMRLYVTVLACRHV